MIAYKVLSVTDCGILISHIAENAALVQYDLDKEITAPKWLADVGYHLLVFDTLRNAENYNNDRPGIVIWEVEVDELLPPLTRGDMTNLDKGFLTCTQALPWPDGTYMARSLKLVRQVV